MFPEKTFENIELIKQLHVVILTIRERLFVANPGGFPGIFAARHGGGGEPGHKIDRTVVQEITVSLAGVSINLLINNSHYLVGLKVGLGDKVKSSTAHCPLEYLSWRGDADKQGMDLRGFIKRITRGTVEELDAMVRYVAAYCFESARNQLLHQRLLVELLFGVEGSSLPEVSLFTSIGQEWSKLLAGGGSADFRTILRKLKMLGLDIPFANFERLAGLYCAMMQQVDQLYSLTSLSSVVPDLSVLSSQVHKDLVRILLACPPEILRKLLVEYGGLLDILPTRNFELTRAVELNQRAIVRLLGHPNFMFLIQDKLPSAPTEGSKGAMMAGSLELLRKKELAKTNFSKDYLRRYLARLRVEGNTQRIQGGLFELKILSTIFELCIRLHRPGGGPILVIGEGNKKTINLSQVGQNHYIVVNGAGEAIIPVMNDGDSLFKAVWFSIRAKDQPYPTPGPAVAMRSYMADYMQAREEVYAPQLLAAQYATDIRHATGQSLTWGGEIELGILAAAYNLRIMVYQPGMPEAIPIGASLEDGATLIHLRREGNHYTVAGADGATVQDIAPNGNCLFEAIRQARLREIPVYDYGARDRVDSVLAMRRLVAERISTHPEEYQGLIEVEINNVFDELIERGGSPDVIAEIRARGPLFAEAIAPIASEIQAFCTRPTIPQDDSALGDPGFLYDVGPH